MITLMDNWSRASAAWGMPMPGNALQSPTHPQSNTPLPLRPILGLLSHSLPATQKNPGFTENQMLSPPKPARVPTAVFDANMDTELKSATTPMPGVPQYTAAPWLTTSIMATAARAPNGPS